MREAFGTLFDRGIDRPRHHHNLGYSILHQGQSQGWYTGFLPQNSSLKLLSSYETKQPLHEAPGNDDSLPETPGSGKSGHSARTISTLSSTKSAASSFARMIRSPRSDKRLFHRSSRPSQHLTKHPSLMKRPVSPKPSPTFYAPRVVEDSRDNAKIKSAYIAETAERQTWMQAIADSFEPTTAESALRTRSPGRRTIRMPRSTASEDQRSEAGTPLSPRLNPFEKRRPGIFRSPSSHDVSKLSTPGVVHLNTPSRPPAHTRDSSSGSSHPVSPRHLHPLSRSGLNTPQTSRYMPPTPPEAEPGASGIRLLQHGDHYFHTFESERVPRQVAAPSVPHDSLHQPFAQRQTEPLRRPPVPKLPSDTQVLTQKKRKRSSILGILTRFPLTDSSAGASKHANGNTQTTSSGTPDIVISPSDTSTMRQQQTALSHVALPPYFAQPRGRGLQRMSDTSPSPLVSPMATIADDDESDRHSLRRFKRSSNSQHSPMSLRNSDLPKKTRRVSLEVPGLANTVAPLESPIVPSGEIAGPQPKYKAADGTEYYKASLTGPGALNFLPSEMKRVTTPPHANPIPSHPRHQRSGGFKGFFFDLRSAQSERKCSIDDESPSASLLKRRSGLLPRKISTPLLLGKPSRPRLGGRGSSSASSVRTRPSNDDLTVTEFEQTPYSTRYNDNRKAERRTMRAFLDETLNEDEDDSVVSFELDVPDHLPNSPLCPLSPKHKSGGKAICPLHGRKKAATMRIWGPQPSAAKIVRKEPEIVYESGPSETRAMGEEMAVYQDRIRRGS